jgi:hypothetical protein
MTGDPVIVLEVDFNDIDERDRVRASLRFSNTWVRPAVGDWVRLFDAEGNTGVGQVDEARHLIVRVRIDWGTWKSSRVLRPYRASVASPARSQPPATASSSPVR